MRDVSGKIPLSGKYPVPDKIPLSGSILYSVKFYRIFTR